MSNRRDEEAPAIKRIRRRLETIFEQRIEFLEATLRTGEVGITGGGECTLDEVLNEREWRPILLWVMHAAELPMDDSDQLETDLQRKELHSQWEGHSALKIKVSGLSRLDFAGIAALPEFAKTAIDFGCCSLVEHVREPRRSRTIRDIEPSHAGKPASRPSASKDAPQAWNRTDELVQRFVKQQLMLVLLELCRAVVYKLPENLAEAVKRAKAAAGVAAQKLEKAKGEASGSPDAEKTKTVEKAQRVADNCAAVAKDPQWALLVYTQGEWLRRVRLEIKTFCDATVLELLAGRTLPGDVGSVAFDESVSEARSAHNSNWQKVKPQPEPDPKKDADKDHAVSARAALEEALLPFFYSDADRSSPYWHLLQKWKSVVDEVVELIKEGDKLVAWCLGLFRAVRDVEAESGAPPDRALAKCVIKSTEPERRDWFYEPERVKQFLSAMEHALHVSRSPCHGGARQPGEPSLRGSEEDRNAADTLEQAADLFIAACVDADRYSRSRDGEAPQGRTLIESHASTPEDRRYKEIQRSLVLRRKLERVWWMSFDWRDPGLPEKLSAWCGRPIPPDWKIQVLHAGEPPGDGQKRGNAAGASPRKPAYRPDESHRVAVIFGAGIAGLTAAHELAERNFEVHVIESKGPVDRPFPPLIRPPGDEATVQVGGVARTQWDDLHPSWPKEGPGPLPGPGEHGYRLFPSFYRHVFDTMKRTPILHPANGARPTAFDQLEPTFRQVFAARERFVPISRARPRTLEAFRREYMSLTQGLGFSRRDLTRFFFKLLRYMMTCSARRAKDYEKMSLLQFLGGDQEGHYSERFVAAIRAAPQALVAMDAERCDARTQANVYLQLLMDQVLGGPYTDSVLSGPTSTAWLIPWREHLEKELGVKFHQGELLMIRGEDRFVEACVAAPEELRGQIPKDNKNKVATADYFVVALDVVGAERVTRYWDACGMPGTPHDGVPRELRGFTTYLDARLPPKLDRYELALTYPPPRRGRITTQDLEDKLRYLLRRARAAKDDGALTVREKSVFRSVNYWTGEIIPPQNDADELTPREDGVPEIRLHAWFKNKVGPAEVRILRTILHQWTSADVRLTSEDPQWFEESPVVRTPRLPVNRYGETATDRLQTFGGVQYYFEQDFKLVRGHVYFPDTEWGLSAVSQSQFWPRGQFPTEGPRIRGVLSVDIGDCRRLSSYTRKSVMGSSAEEIQKEVWRQIRDSLRTTRGPAASVTSLPLPEPTYYHVDTNLIFSGTAMRGNRTPFLINNVGDWKKRPRCLPWVPGRSKLGDGECTDGTGLWQAPHGGYRVHEDHVVFCGSYMRTFTRMTTMEGANESARHAVNAILDHISSTFGTNDFHGWKQITGDYCDIWDLEEQELEDLAFFKRVDEMLFKAGKPPIADILQFDKLADMQYPEPSPGQSLLAALGATMGKDWGVEPNELAGSMNGLMELVRGMSKDMGAIPALGIPSLGGAEPTMLKLLSMLGIGKGGAGNKEP